MSYTTVVVRVGQGVKGDKGDTGISELTIFRMFADELERDDYFTDNPTDLVDGRVICITDDPAEFQSWSGTEWVDVPIGAITLNTAGVINLPATTYVNGNSRSLDSKLYTDLPTLLDYDGADPTGVTASDSAFLAFLADLQDQGGGVLIIPPGTWWFDDPFILDELQNIHIKGYGPGVTKIIRKKNFSSASFRFIRGTNNTISDLTIDCDGYRGRGVYLQDIRSKAVNVHVLNCPNRPFGMNGGGNDMYGIDSNGNNSDEDGFTTPSFYPIGCSIIQCYAYNAGQTAFSQKRMRRSKIMWNECELVYSEGLTVDVGSDYSQAIGNTLINVARTDSATAFPNKENPGQYLVVGTGGVGGIGIDGPNYAKIRGNSVVGVHMNATAGTRHRPAVSFASQVAGTVGVILSENHFEDADIGIFVKAISDGAAGPSYGNIIGPNTFKSVLRHYEIGDGNEKNIIKLSSSPEDELIVYEDEAGNNQIEPAYQRPITVLAIGEGNMAVNSLATGGDYRIEKGVYLFDNDTSDSSLFVQGTKFLPAAWGTAPLNIENGGVYAQSLALHTANELKRITGRDVYVYQVAAEEHSIEAFMTDAMLSANGWTRPAGNQDLSSYIFTESRAAIEAVPGMPYRYDIVIVHHGESNYADGQKEYAHKFCAFIDELFDNVVSFGQGNIICGELAQTSINAWATGTAYTTVSVVSNNGYSVYTCKLGHTSDANSEPGVGASWQTYWDEDVTKRNAHRERHWWALRRAEQAFFNVNPVASTGINTQSSSVYFSGQGVVSMGKRYGLAAVSKREELNPETDEVRIRVDQGLSSFTTYASPCMPRRTPISYSSASFATAKHNLLGRCWASPANIAVLIYTRRIFRVPFGKLITITYEIAVAGSSGGSVDHRAVVYQYDKDMKAIGQLTPTPSSSPAAVSDGRVIVTRTFGRSGLSADTDLGATCEFVAPGVNFGVGGDDEAYYFNILEISV